MNETTPNKFIVIEGISGSGKTEISKILADKMSARYYTTPSSFFRKVRQRADKMLSLEARFLFYLASVVQASWEIGKILEAQSVICDKYIWSTMCYHTVYGLKCEIPMTIHYRKPDYVFLLVCEEERRLLRLRNRGPIRDMERYSLRQDMERRCLIEFRKHVKQEIDNSSDGLQSATDQILNIIR